MKWATKAVALLLAIAVQGIDAAPPKKQHPVGKCRNKLQRKAWHTLSKKEKKAYLDAETCVMKLPATLGLPGTRTRFDELQAAHVIQADWTHEVGAFLPFHRYMLHAHEEIMRKECGYKGAQPYWYEPQDAGRIAKSSILDPVYGFGGDGSGPENCIQDGPFKDYVNGLGPFHEIRDHCIDRKITEEAGWYMSQSFIDYCYQYDNYDQAWWCLKGAVHFGGHSGIGGQLVNPVSSPGDPLFYLHHTWLDKTWWDWQARSLPARLHDIGGKNGEQNPCTIFSQESFMSAPRNPRSKLPYPPWPNGTFVFEILPDGSNTYPGYPPFPKPEFCVDGVDTRAPPAYIPGKEGDDGDVTTMGHVLSLLGILPNITVGDTMDIGNDYLCYEYVDP